MRHNRLIVILSEEERKRVIAEANRDGISESGWARMTLIRAIDEREMEREARVNRMKMIDGK